jgi:signal transduction histidine kinase
MTAAPMSALQEKGRDAGMARQRGQLIADLFHAVNQPITALQCSVELSLRRPPSEQQYRDTLQAALQHAEQIARQVAGIRELLQADDPGDNPEVLSLAAFLHELVTDLEPVAESLGVRFSLTEEASCHIRIEPHRLQQALFYLLEYALGTSGTGSTVALAVGERGKESLVRLDSAWVLPKAPDPGNCSPQEKAQILSQRLELGIARGIIETAGGRLDCEQKATSLHIEVGLPLDCREPFDVGLGN